MSNVCAAAVVTPWENVIFCKHPTSAEIYHDSSGGYWGTPCKRNIKNKYLKKKAHQQTHTDQCLPCLAVYTSFCL